jgi:predicted nucleic-acid-binding protein
MIGLDTNVLIRLFVDDPNRGQVEAARRLARETTEPIRISVVVLIESIWTLRRHYGIKKAGLLRFLNMVLDNRAFSVENRVAIEDALETYNRTRLDYGDCLIEAVNRASGVRTTYTFDQTAATRRHFSLLETER